MAEQKKKSTNAGKGTVGSQKKSTTKKSTSGNSQSRSASGSAKQKARQRENQIATRRMYAGLCCFILALFGILGYFNTEAIVLNWCRKLFCGLIGVGYWVLPLALIGAGIFLFQTRKKPFLGRVICTLLVPALIGGLHHVVWATDAYPDGFVETVKLLWSDGQYMVAGGAFSGLITLWLCRLISRVGAFLILLLILVLLIMKICKCSLGDISNLIRTKYAKAAERAAQRREERLEEEDWEEDELDSYPQEEPEEQPASNDPGIPDALQGILSSRRVKTEKPENHKKSEKGAAPLEKPEIPIFDPEEPVEPLPQVAAFTWNDDDEDEVPAPVSRKTPTPVLDEDEPIDFVDSGAIGVAARKTSQELLQASEEGESELILPDKGVKVTREPAVKKVTGKEAAVAQKVVARQIAENQAVEQETYQYPTPDLLEKPKTASNAGIKEEMASTEAILVDTIESFGINVHLKDVTRGPTVARFEMELDRGIKLSKLTNLADDIALSLGVSGVRIAPVLDKPSMVGIEVPNRKVTPVPIRSVLETDAFRHAKSKLSFALGKDISGTCIIGDISKMPHLMIAGTTGSGKSVCINSLLISLIYKASPKDVRLILVDPKKVELGVYNEIPHLLIPVVTEAKKAAGALQWAVLEMSRRYSEIADAGVRKLSEYNKLAERDPDREPMPSIVIVIDELADLMMVVGKEVEESICRIAQLGRAAGMHLVVATQRPSADVITGLMKSNIPSRIAFAVASAIESRIILDTAGAEKLVGKGDMLYHPIGSNKALRVQGCMISDEEVAAVVDFVKQNSTAQYDNDITQSVNQAAANAGTKSGKGSASSEGGDYDELIPDAVDVILEIGQASVSMLQRKLKLGYARAARLMDQMEELGYVGPFEGSKPRQLKITKEEWAVKRAELYGANPRQTELDMNQAAMADDLNEPEDVDLDSEPEDLEFLAVEFRDDGGADDLDL